jgi:hypothetical protein
MILFFNHGKENNSRVKQVDTIDAVLAGEAFSA